MKKCYRCKLSLSLELFNFQNDKPRSYCKKCERDYGREYQRSKRYREYERNYRKKSKSYKKSKRLYEGSEKYKKWRREYRKLPHVRKAENEYKKSDTHRGYIKLDLASNLRSRLYQAIKNEVKSGSAVNDLGCSIKELKIYLEKKFSNGMNWDNHGRGGWHIDHIVQLSSFDLTNRKQFLKAVHYSNLQPLWEFENCSKNIPRRR